jgi:hypothetical protein
MKISLAKLVGVRPRTLGGSRQTEAYSLRGTMHPRISGDEGNGFSWARPEPKAAIWQNETPRSAREPRLMSGEWEGLVEAESLPKAALTIHAGGKVSEDSDHLVVRPVSYVHEANCIVLSIGCASA